MPPQPRFISVFISQAISKCSMMFSPNNHCGHVTELSTEWYADIKGRPCLQGAYSHIGGD